MKKKPALKEKIKGLEWTFHVQTNSAYTRAHGKDSEAVTYPHSREVYFNISCLSPYAVKHELLHVFVASSSTSSSSLTADQVEELCAEIVGEHGIDIEMLSEKILNYFLR